MAGELTRLTPRDRLLLDLLDAHKTFTTEQIHTLAFTSLARTRIRLGQLYTREILDRFRHYTRPGSQSWRWCLGPVGAAILAAGRGDTLPRPATVRDATARVAMSPTLPHLVTVNGFFVALTGHARTHGGTRLRRWWNEARCREQVGAVVRPDGHGVWVAGTRAVPFWLEADLGTETLSRVAGKLTGYAALPPSWAYPVLFWFPTGARELNFHAYLTRTGVPDAVTVATAAADHAADTGPVGPVWRVAGHPGRVSLADLAPHGDGAPWDG
ncbi:replication-relaxation family protein [Krasilnikovia cinnamomea]|uniref:replication-relaxation family protein n=1 Tax=Krasilnikovia cinnamomea TaxID=349313 RepID=UPI00102C8C11|nr:replication-relaxation family protein [Krasilnikovia cinnamomea]